VLLSRGSDTPREAVSSYDPGVLGRLDDGTPFFAPLGELAHDRDENRVQCHLCGAWYRALAPTHLASAHGLTADEYRDLVGLRPRHSLWARDLIEAHAARLRARLAAEPRLRAAMAIGRALARRGELQREARARLAERPVSLERQRQLSETGARLGGARAAAFRQRRGIRAVELGFLDLAAYYAVRYGEERRRLDEIASELGCAESAVRGDLRRLGLGPDRTRSHGARWGVRCA
jgi:hypothetical protein